MIQQTTTSSLSHDPSRKARFSEDVKRIGQSLRHNSIRAARLPEDTSLPWNQDLQDMTTEGNKCLLIWKKLYSRYESGTALELTPISCFCFIIFLFLFQKKKQETKLRKICHKNIFYEKCKSTHYIFPLRNLTYKIVYLSSYTCYNNNKIQEALWHYGIQRNTNLIVIRM